MEMDTANPQSSLPPNTPKVSVIIPCYNVAPFLTKRAVNSIRKQTFHDWEMILIDDHSVDNTLHVAEQLVKEDSRIRLVKHHENKGLSAARNTGIAQAKADYITLLDADDEFMPTYLEKVVEVLNNTPKVRLVQTNFFLGNSDNVHEFPENMTLEDHLAGRHFLICHTFRKSCWKQVGGFDERIRYAEDWHYVLKLYTQNLRHYTVIREPLFWYRKDNETSLSSTVKFDVVKKNHRLIYNDFSESYDQHMKPLFRRMVKYWFERTALPPRTLLIHPLRWSIEKKPFYFLLLHGIFLVKCAHYLLYLWARACKRTFVSLTHRK